MAGGYHAEFAARVLAEAAILGDKSIAAQYGISTRTVRRYRDRETKDPALAALVKEHKAAFLTNDWLASTRKFLDAYIRKVHSLVPNASLKDLVGLGELVTKLGELDFFAKRLGAGGDVDPVPREQADSAGEARDPAEGDGAGKDTAPGS